MLKKILVLDDEENYAEMLQAVLEEHYFVTDIATDPAKALQEVERNGYSLVIADYRMPVMDGADFLLKARSVDPDIPIILVSGLMNTPELLKVANLGVTLVFEKPLNVSNFLEAVRRYVPPLSADEFYRYRSGHTPGHEGTADPRHSRPTYPAKPTHASSESPLLQHFLSQLWDSVQAQSHVFVKTPAGVEVELVLRDLCQWHHGEQRSLSMLLAYHPPTSMPPWLAQMEAYEDCSHIIGVMGYQLATMEQQECLVDMLREAPEQAVFVHFINANLLELSSSRLHPELLELLREELLEMPPLHLRLADLATYIHRYLPLIARKEGKPRCNAFQHEALGLLLGHHWPLNFGELLEVLRRSVQLAEDGHISKASLAEAFNRIGVQNRSSSEALALEPWLTHRQRNLLRARLPAFGDDLAELLRAAGVNTQHLPSPPRLEELPLLFPELLEPKALGE